MMSQKIISFYPEVLDENSDKVKSFIYRTKSLNIDSKKEDGPVILPYYLVWVRWCNSHQQ